MPSPRHHRRFGALGATTAAAIALTTLVAPSAGADPHAGRVARSQATERGGSEKVAAEPCDRVAYVVGDSRRSLEHMVLPQTTDRVWAAQLGIRGDRQGTHVRYLARPGAVHAWFDDEMDALMAACVRGERPLVFDFMGTNYAVAEPTRIDDPAFYDELEAKLVDFYDAHAPRARVVLAELTLNRSTVPSDVLALIDRYLAGYNGMLQDLARSHPGRFFYLSAPSIYEDGTIAWRDVSHETFEAPLAEYLGQTPAGQLDADALAIVDAADQSPCALLADERFGVAQYSEGASLGAYLQDFHASRAARRWLARTNGPGAIHLAEHTTTCDYRPATA